MDRRSELAAIYARMNHERFLTIEVASLSDEARECWNEERQRRDTAEWQAEEAGRQSTASLLPSWLLLFSSALGIYLIAKWSLTTTANILLIVSSLFCALLALLLRRPRTGPTSSSSLGKKVVAVILLIDAPILWAWMSPLDT